MAVTFGTNGGNAAGLWSTYILRKFIPALRDNLVLAQYAEKASLPKGEGALIARWNTMANLTVDTTVLEEGSATDNEVTEVAITAVEATVAAYGQWMKISDLAEESVTRSALDAYADTFAFAGAKVLDMLVYNAAVTTTNALKSGDTSASGTLTTLETLTAQDAVVAGELLRAANARGYENLGNKYFVGIAAEQELHLVTDVTTGRLSWSNVFQHTSPGLDRIVNKTNGDVVGAIGRVVVGICDAVGTVVVDTGVTGYRGLAMGRHGVGWLGFGTKQTSPKIIMKRPGPSDTSNPLNQYMTMGYKFKGVSKLLSAARVFTVYSAI